ncbi:MAG: hypothetical protein RL385_3980 [Pseudomonadota bacterium]
MNRWALGLLLLFAVFLAWGGLAALLPLEVPPLRTLASSVGVARFLAAIGLWCGVRIIQHAPLGVLSAWACAPLQAPGKHRLFAGLSCVLLAVLSVPLLAGRELSTLRILLPLLGALLGFALAAFFVAGPRVRRALLILMCAACVVPCVVGSYYVQSAISGTPSLPEGEPLDVDARRQIVARFRGGNPRNIPAGERHSVELAAHEVDALVRWLAAAGLRARASTTLVQDGFEAAASVPIPQTSYWINLRGVARVALEHGRIRVRRADLTFGSAPISGTILTVVIRGVIDELQKNPDLHSIVSTISALELNPQSARVTYGRLDAQRGLFARLVWGEDDDGEVRARVLSYVERLVASLAQSEAGDARFLAALRTAFSEPAELAPGVDGVEEHRCALIALGVVLGHPGLAHAVGISIDAGMHERIERLRAGVTLRGRNDWVRHFAVSGALTVLSDVAPSDAVGLLKEQHDADGGSGFSFADLLADRAGTTLAEKLTLDPDGARAVRLRLSRDLRVDMVFPDATGLPEGIQEAAFEADYGGLTGARYKTLLTEIEERIASLPP